MGVGARVAGVVHDGPRQHGRDDRAEHDGAIAEGLAWQWIFWLNLPVGVVTILLTARRVDETVGPNTRFDLVGVVLVTLGAFGVVWGLVRGNAAGWGSGEVLGALVLGVALVIAFVQWERRTAAPMLPMRFFRHRAFATANPANFLVFASLYGTMFFLAQYFQTVRGAGPLVAGLMLMPWTGTLMVCALIIGSAGCTMAMPAAQKAVVGAVLPQEIGQASGAFMMLRIFGGVFGVAVTVAVFALVGMVTALGMPRELHREVVDVR